MSQGVAVRSLYRQMLRAGKQFADYNFREYTVRQVQLKFRQNRDLTDHTVVEKLLKQAQTDLQVINRQASLSRMYHEGGNVIDQV